MSGVPDGLARQVGHDPPQRVPAAVDPGRRSARPGHRLHGSPGRCPRSPPGSPAARRRRRGRPGRPCRTPGPRPKRLRRGGSRTSIVPPRLGAGPDPGWRCHCRPGRDADARRTGRRPSSARSAGRTTGTPGRWRARPNRRVARAPAGSPPCRHDSAATVPVHGWLDAGPVAATGPAGAPHRRKQAVTATARTSPRASGPPYGKAWRAPVGRIHWVGAECARQWNGYMESAVRSGKAAAAAAVAELRQPPLDCPCAHGGEFQAPRSAVAED